MKYRNVADSIWSDPDFLGLSANAKLIWLFCLTNPNLNLIGIFHAPDQIMSAYTGIGRESLPKYIAELQQSGMLAAAYGYVILINYAKYNAYRDANTLRGVRLAFAALPDEVWRIAMGYERIAELYDSCLIGELNREEERRAALGVTMPDIQDDLPLPLPSDPKKKKGKEKESENLLMTADDLNENGKKAKEMIAKIFKVLEKDPPKLKSNACCKLTPAHVDELIEKLGSMEMLFAGLEVYYNWKYEYDKEVISDYRRMLRPWVKQRAEEACVKLKQSGSTPDPIQQEKRRQEQIKAAQDEKLKNAEIIKTVNAKKWHEFDTFYEFMRWTSKLPDQDAVNGYEMPDRVRQMRSAPSISMISILAGKPCPQWAEDEFAEIKKEMK
jgi:hypothetical protein